jgi:hypothetical protein
MNAVAEPSPANRLWRLEPARWGLSDLLIQTVKKELLASTGNFVGLYQSDPMKLKVRTESVESWRSGAANLCCYDPRPERRIFPCRIA